MNEYKILKSAAIILKWMTFSCLSFHVQCSQDVNNGGAYDCCENDSRLWEKDGEALVHTAIC